MGCVIKPHKFGDNYKNRKLEVSRYIGNVSV